MPTSDILTLSPPHTGNSTGLCQPLLLSPTGYGNIHRFDFVFLRWRVQWAFSHRLIHPAYSITSCSVTARVLLLYCHRDPFVLPPRFAGPTCFKFQNFPILAMLWDSVDISLARLALCNMVSLATCGYLNFSNTKKSARWLHCAHFKLPIASYSQWNRTEQWKCRFHHCGSRDGLDLHPVIKSLM